MIKYIETFVFCYIPRDDVTIASTHCYITNQILFYCNIMQARWYRSDLCKPSSACQIHKTTL